MPINKQQFEKEIGYLEVLPPFFEGDKSASRREAMLDSLEDLDYEVVRQARRDYLKDRDNRFFPTPGEFRGICEDILQSQKNKREYAEPHTAYHPLLHNCSTVKPEPTEALKWVSLILPYEAQHVLCEAKTAICPKCGHGHQREHPLLVGMRDYKGPDGKLLWEGQMEGWNYWAKGLLLCVGCDGKD